MMSFLHPSNRGCTLVSSFCSLVFPGCFTTGEFVGSLLYTNHGMGTSLLTPSPSIRARGERGHRRQSGSGGEHNSIFVVVEDLFILFYVFEYFACVYVCTLSMCLVSAVAQ